MDLRDRWGLIDLCGCCSVIEMRSQSLSNQLSNCFWIQYVTRHIEKLSVLLLSYEGGVSCLYRKGTITIYQTLPVLLLSNEGEVSCLYRKGTYTIYETLPVLLLLNEGRYLACIYKRYLYNNISTIICTSIMK